jgi:hypothetical protein
MIAAVSNRGLMRFMLYDGALNVDRFLTFLRRLIKDARQKVFLIVDNLKVHHARKVKAWVESHRHEIELFYLPAYHYPATSGSAERSCCEAARDGGARWRGHPLTAGRPNSNGGSGRSSDGCGAGSSGTGRPST